MKATLPLALGLTVALASFGAAQSASCPCAPDTIQNDSAQLVPGGGIEKQNPQAQRGQRGQRDQGENPQWEGRRAFSADQMIERLDANGNGTLEPSEMPEGRGRRGGLTTEQMFEQFDTNGDGSLSAEEFAAQREAMRANRPDGQGLGQDQAPRDGSGRRGGPMPEQLLQRMDTDGNGTIEISELPEGERAQRLAEADTDGNGSITDVELQTFLEANRPNRQGPPEGEGLEGQGPQGDRPPRGLGQRPEGGGARNAEAFIMRLDADGNGTLEVSELPEGRGQNLAEADTDGNGVISTEELNAHLEANREMRRGQRGPGEGGPQQRGPRQQGQTAPPAPQF